MTFELLCAVFIALLVGVAMIFNGYRWFLIFLPIFGFVFGFGLGAQTMQVLFSQPMFTSISGLVVGLLVGVVFAVLSYFIYLFGVTLYAGAVGYGLAIAIMQALGLGFGFLTWLVGIVAAVALAFVVLKFNVQKYVIIIGTSIAGAGVVIASLIYAFNPNKELIADFTRLAVKAAISTSFWWLVFIVLVGAGIYTQIVTTRTFVLTVEDKKY